MALEISVILAQFWGSLFIILGLLSFRTKLLGKTIKRTENMMFTVSTGYVTLILGLGTVILHNIWVFDWTVIITILGWCTLIKGILKMGFPEHVHKQARNFKNRQDIESLVLALFGAWLLWMSFI